MFFQKNELDEKEFFRVIRAAFGQKRKQLANTLATVTDNKKTAQEILRAAGINPASRAQELSLAQWRTLVGLVS